MMAFALTEKDHRGLYSGCIPAGVLYMPAKDAVPALGRESSENDAADIMSRTYKMKGAVLLNDEVIKAMEENADNEFIPVKKTKDGYSSFSKLITEEQFENLRKYSYALLKETAEKLADGRIEAVPLMTDKKNLPCEYCDYYSVCGEYPPEKVRVYADNSEETIEKIMNGEEV